MSNNLGIFKLDSISYICDEIAYVSIKFHKNPPNSVAITNLIHFFFDRVIHCTSKTPTIEAINETGRYEVVM